MMVFTKIFTSIIFVFFLEPTNAFWRMECPGSTYARLDPLVDPGVISDHMHTIHGASNFGMTVTYDDLMKSDCTSCRVTQDKSVYWTPSVHFAHSDGTVEMVPQDGGMIVYYFQRGDHGGTNVTAFPKGFRMLAGDARLRSYSGSFPDKATSFWDAADMTESNLRQKALGFNCLHYSTGHNEDTLYRHFMPDKSFLDSTCSDGLRLELVFPSCWNGRDLDSTNHKDHVAYPSFVQSGDCPPDFPIRLPTILYETKWQTNRFNNKAGTFVLSNGDPTGCGYHGDFIAGWEPSFLQQALDTCLYGQGTLEECPVFKLQTYDNASKCHFKVPDQLKNENPLETATTLPGNVPIQSGPGYASKLDGAVASSSASTSSVVMPTPTTTPVKQTSTPTTQSKPTSTTRSDTASAAQFVEIAATISSPILTPSPTPTTSNSRIVSYTTYTSDGAVYEVAIEEVEITVTATTTVYEDAAMHKRHVHMHGHGSYGRGLHRRHHHHAY